MTASIGSRLGPYELLASLGAGGMGEVYRARDTRLERDVALKMLPRELGDHPQLRERFEREARTISQLNHPHICTVYDFGEQDGTGYLVMELVEGETLAARIARGPLPLADVLRYGIQIAEALDRAHRTGIVHRDLKPANIMLAKGGVKLLDFGLARSIGVRHAGQDAPTEKALTGEGTLVGTLPYMSPEQLHGLELDARSDLFAFGAVLYEMVTGRRAFSAPSSASLIAQILEHTPPAPSELERIVPPSLEQLILSCLEKDRDSRFQCAADVAHQLRWIPKPSAVPAPASGETTAPRRRRRVSAAALVLVVSAAAAMTAYRLARPAPSAFAAARFTQLTFDAGEEGEPSLAPDGKMFAFVRETEGNLDVFLQRIDGRSAINLTGDSKADDSQPAFSPDGTQVAFRSERDGGGIFVMGATGESVRRVSDKGFNPSWSPDGRELLFSAQRARDPAIVYGIRNVYVADVASGSTRLLSNKEDLMQPVWSPHGHRIAYWTARHGNRDIMTIDRSGRAETVTSITSDTAIDWNPIWSSDGGHLYFCSDRDGSMNVWRIAVDEKSGKAKGVPEPVRVPGRDIGFISLSADGRRLLYQSATTSGALIRLRFDPAKERLTEDPAPLFHGSLTMRYLSASPDGRWIAFTVRGGQEDVNVMAADGSGMRQLTNDEARDRGVAWWPDGSRIVFYSNRKGAYDAWTIRPDGGGLTRLTAFKDGVNFPLVSPDQTKLAVVGDLGPGGIVSLAGPLPATKPATTLPDLPGGRFMPQSWSPDGTLLAGAPYGSVGLHVYSLETGTVTPLVADARTAAFVDARRLLFVDTQRRVGVADVVTRQVRIIGSLPATNGRFDRGAIAMSSTSIVAVSSNRESDIWEMSLPAGGAPEPAQ
jgi:Tol biopolymer transport system component